jgi:hypothetical protein
MTEKEPPLEEVVEKCVAFVRECAQYMYESVADKDHASILSTAFARASVLLEDMYFMNRVMASELQQTLKRGKYDEDSILRILTEWKRYENDN